MFKVAPVATGDSDTDRTPGPSVTASKALRTTKYAAAVAVHLEAGPSSSSDETTARAANAPASLRNGYSGIPVKPPPAAQTSPAPSDAREAIELFIGWMMPIALLQELHYHRVCPGNSRNGRVARDHTTRTAFGQTPYKRVTPGRMQVTG